MLFDFKRQLIARMWMRNTLIPLDMLFIHEDGEIINIAQNTVPYSQEILSSTSEVRYVLEINGGLSEKLGIKPGDQVEPPKTLDHIRLRLSKAALCRELQCDGCPFMNFTFNAKGAHCVASSMPERLGSPSPVPGVSLVIGF